MRKIWGILFLGVMVFACDGPRQWLPADWELWNDCKILWVGCDIVNKPCTVNKLKARYIHDEFIFQRVCKDQQECKNCVVEWLWKEGCWTWNIFNCGEKEK